MYSDTLKFRELAGEANLETIPCDFEQLVK